MKINLPLQRGRDIIPVYLKQRGPQESQHLFFWHVSHFFNVEFLSKIEIWSHIGYLLMALIRVIAKEQTAKVPQCCEILLLDDSSLILK